MKPSEQAVFDVTQQQVLDTLEQVQQDVADLGNTSSATAVMSLHRLELMFSQVAQGSNILAEHMYKRALEEINFEVLLDTWHQHELRTKQFKDLSALTFCNCLKLVAKYVPGGYDEVIAKVDVYLGAWNGLRDEVPNIDERKVLVKASLDVIDSLLFLVSQVSSHATRLELVMEMSKFFTE